MEFSLTLPRYQDPHDRVPFRETYEFARQVEELGYAGGFVGHHSFTPETKDPSAPFVLLSAIAAHTERLQLGTGIYLAALHHPVNICEQVSTLDQVSNGRAVLGVGTGYRRYEFDNYGSAFAHRGRRLDETLALLKKAWTTGSYEWHGELGLPRVEVTVGSQAAGAVCGFMMVSYSMGVNRPRRTWRRW
jgi:alkanesulfonate monooxygenase SsuD/methylene tetrahydromethanopterin reductase-like flavin-dependent oxidoreductase (luciferase family)